VLIAGDAAHLMPPFLGQGMCSGVRDAANIAWKLNLVLRGLADDTLLDSYTIERKPHVASIIEQAVALGRISCTIDAERARQRDAAFLSGRVPPPPPFPWITEGILLDSPSGLAGRLAPQARVECRGRQGLADDVIGQGWQLICDTGVPATADAATRSVLATLNVHTLELNGRDGMRDIDGVYGKYLAGAHVNAVLVRPDFYVYGAAGPSCSLDALVADLAGKLALRPSVGAATTFQSHR
jgi:3-(3-hydroxy-phenyl)propionate hydroxylase